MIRKQTLYADHPAFRGQMKSGEGDRKTEFTRCHSLIPDNNKLVRRSNSEQNMVNENSCAPCY
jgi:hypothetical protein